MSKPLFNDTDESDTDVDFKLNTNKEYAKVYNDFRKKELLKKFKDRGYNNISENESESSSTDDEDEDEVNAEFDKEFFKTLASLKSKDPSIYDKETQFFTSLTDDTAKQIDVKPITTNAKSKPVTLKDYERQVILENGGKFEDSDEEEIVGAFQRSTSPTAVEEERHLKAEFQKALNAKDSDDEEFGGIFKKRVKSKEEKNLEDEDFAEWLAGKKAVIEAKAKEKLEPLKNYWNQKNLPQSERFLRDYILNKGYCNTKSNDIPTYDEIVGDNNVDIEPQPLSDDEKELEKQAQFEEKYNFRFEEPDTEFIKRFPRTIDNSLRLDSGKRKEKRQELKKRKLDEKEQKMKELEILKEMKRKEIEEKIEKLKKVTGNEELGFNDAELEEDFDPEAHDRRMCELFNDEYYQVDEGEDKPECPSDIDELKIEDWDNYDPAQMANIDNDYVPHCEDDDFNMDCDYDPEAASSSKQQLQQELIENTKRRKNRRGRRNRFMEMIQEEKPPFNPEDEKTYGEYIEEYYKMDCEDIVADIPCRFKYVETTPNDFGLTIEEILLAKNKELNQWASLKKTLQIRPDQVEKRDQRLYKLKAKNEALKRKIFKSLYGDNSDDENEDETQETDKTTENINFEATETETEMKTNTQLPVIGKKSKKKRKSKKSSEIKINVPLTETVAKITKIENPFAKKDVTESKSNNDSLTPAVDATANLKKPKKKKKKKTGTVVVSSQNASIDAVKSQVRDVASSPTKNLKTTESNHLQKPKHINPFTAKRDKKSNVFENKKSNINQKSKPKFKPPKNKKFNGKFTNSNQVQINDDRLKAYNINPRKFHKKQKFEKKSKPN